MQRFEYKIVPAPTRANKGARKAPSAADRLSIVLADVMNTHGQDGWEYLRSEYLPLEERRGLFARQSVSQHHVLVFRRALPVLGDMTAPLVPPSGRPAETFPPRSLSPAPSAPRQQDIATERSPTLGAAPALGPAAAPALGPAPNRGVTKP